MKSIAPLLLTAAASVAMAQSSFTAEVLLSDSFDSSTVINSPYIRFSDLGSSDWKAIDGTKWRVASGNLSNAGGGSRTQNDGGVAKLIDLTGLSDTSLNKLKLDINFETAEASETLYVHLRGFIGSAPEDSTNFIALGASKGNAWDSTRSAFKATTNKVNLNSGIGFDRHTNTEAASAVLVSDGSAGVHKFSQTFDMSGYGVSDITGYDYLLVAITRKAIDSNAAVTISDISVTAVGEEPESSAMTLFDLGDFSLILHRR